jgi:tetratricopeptide (TPR) repeat protein
MVLDWLGGSKDADALMARRKYPQAIEALRQLLQKHGGDLRLRMKLADALVLAGREREAAPVLLELADALAAKDRRPRASRLLKKVQKIDPGRADVEGKLADLIKTKERRTKGFDPQGEKAVGYEPPSWAASTFSPEQFAAPRIYSDAERIAAAKGASWVPATRSDEGPTATSETSAAPSGDTAAEATLVEVEIQILDVIQDALTRPIAAATAAAPAASPAAAPPRRPLSSTPPSSAASAATSWSRSSRACVFSCSSRATSS